MAISSSEDATKVWAVRFVLKIVKASRLNERNPHTSKTSIKLANAVRKQEERIRAEPLDGDSKHVVALSARDVNHQRYVGT